MNKNLRMSIAALTALLLAAGAAIVIADDVVPTTVERSVVEAEFTSAKTATERADLVAVARLTGLAERKIVKTSQPGEEGYFPGDASDVYSVLEFTVDQPIKGSVTKGGVVPVAILTGLASNRKYVPGQRVDRVSDDAFNHLFTTDKKALASDVKGAEYLLVLHKMPGQSAFQGPSWSLAPLADGKADLNGSAGRVRVGGAPQTSAGTSKGTNRIVSVSDFVDAAKQES